MSDSSHSFVCIMAGGSGERFWPMSRTRVPKHLLKLFSGRTLLEETVRRIGTVVPRGNILVLTNEAQLADSRRALEGLLPEEQIIAEPAKRDTAPAAALATALARARGGDAATVALLPADALIKDGECFQAQLAAALGAAASRSSLLTFGIKPSHPATGFGYLELEADQQEDLGKFHLRKAKRFVEKPDLATATRYLSEGRYVWNAGIFVWGVRSFLAEADRHAPELAEFVRGFPTGNPAAYLADKFSRLPKISVDYAIMEKAQRVDTLLAEFDWDDVGSWTALSAHWPADAAGNTVRGAVVATGATNNIAVSNGRLIALCGVKDLVVVETADAVLVCHRDAVQEIKKLMASLPKELL